MGRQKKGKTPRKRSGKPLRRRRKKSNKMKHSKWKRDYPEYFEEVDYYPYFIRKDGK